MDISEISRPDNPRVSVVIPNYNHTRYVAGAIQSVLDQSVPAYELIVVDDGSTDESREVVSRFGSQVRYIWQENQGLAGARNTGIRAATGELVGLLDADDQWLPTYLETMLPLADQYPEAAVYYCQARCVDEMGAGLPRVLGGPVVDPDSIYSTLLRANFLLPSTTLLRRDVIVQAGLFDSSLRSCEDWDLWLRILPEQRFVGTSECLVFYRQHDKSLSKNIDGMLQAAQAVIEKNFGPDDGAPHCWSAEKRRAFGGLYRYYALSHVQHQDNWSAAVPYLRQALLVDPTLSQDLSFFYDLAMGSQPVGRRGTAQQLDLDSNAERLLHLLAAMFDTAEGSNLQPLVRKTYGTAYFAVGLLAYNTQQLGISRRALAQALYYRPELYQDARVSGNLLKAFAGATVVSGLRRFSGRVASPSTIEDRPFEPSA